MPQYEIVLRSDEQETLRLTSYPLLVGDVLRFGDVEWVVERAENTDNPAAVRRFVCRLRGVSEEMSS